MLLHHDLSLWNALVRPRTAPAGAAREPDGPDGWEVAAIIDFEWCGVGSAASEFSTVMKSMGDCMHPPAFWEAYLDGGRPDAAFAREGTYHTMLYRLTLTNVAPKHWGAAAVRRQVNEVERLLKGAPAWAFKDVDGAGLA